MKERRNTRKRRRRRSRRQRKKKKKKKKKKRLSTTDTHNLSIERAAPTPSQTLMLRVTAGQSTGSPSFRVIAK